MENKRNKETNVRQEVQKRYQAELLRYRRQIEKIREPREQEKAR